MNNRSKLHIKNNYGVVPTSILNSEDLSLSAKGLFSYLQSKPPGWRFSVRRIEKQNKDGKASIGTAARELENKGYLQRTPIKNDQGKWDGYDYILTEKPFTEKRSTEKRSTEKPLTENRVTLSKKDNSKIDSSKIEVELFDIFWKEYPTKIGKPAAKKAFKSLKVSENKLKDILKGLKEWKETSQWKEQKGKFIPYPATFLNQRRWEDNVPEEPEKEKKPYYRGDPVIEKYGKKWVISQGQWLVFAGSNADIEYK